MNVYDLEARLGLNTRPYEEGLNSAEQKSSAFGSVLKANLVTKGVELVAKGFVKASEQLVAFSKVAVQTGMQFDSAMAQVAATMGTTVDQIGNLRDFAQEMGATTAFSATQAAEALNYMALAGYDAETSMETLPTVLNLAAAGGMDLARASDMVTDAQSALGLTLPETTAMVDQMAAAASKSNTSVSQLGDAFLTIGATARNLKGGTTELSTILGVLADNGIKGAEGGTHLRNMILSLQNPTKDATKLLNSMNISLYDGDGNMRSMVDIIGDLQTGMEGMDQASKDAIISGIFNKTDLAAVNALVGTSRDRFDELTEAISNSKGAAEAMANTQLDNLAGDITLMQSAAEGAKIAFSDGLSPAIRDVVQRITAFLSKTDTQKFLTEMGQKVGELAKTLTQKIGNALPRIAALFEDGGKKVKIFGIAVAGAITAIKAAANPVGALASALGLLAGASVIAGLTADELYTKFDGLSQVQRDGIDATMDAIDAYHEMKDSRDKQNAAIDEESKKTEDLWTELQTLADAEGHVSEENQSRAQYILGELNTALGTEYSMNDGIIQQYAEMRQEIIKLIDARRAERKLKAAEADYDAAKEGLKKVAETIHDSQRVVDEANASLADYQGQLEELRATSLGNVANNPNATLGQQTAFAAAESDLLGKIAGQQAVLDEYTPKLNDALAAEREYHEDIMAFEEAELAYSQGYYDQVEALLDKDALNRAKHAVENGNITQDELNDLTRKADVALSEIERYKKNLDAGVEGYTEEGYQKLNAEIFDMLAVIKEGQEQLDAEATAAGEGVASGVGDGMSPTSDIADTEMSETIKALTDRAQEFKRAGILDASAYVSGFNGAIGGLNLPGPNGAPQAPKAIGMDFVPYNDYPALLHRGEAVLTAREADEWRRGESDGGIVEIIQNIQTVPQTPVELAAATASAFEQARWAL